MSNYHRSRAHGLESVLVLAVIIAMVIGVGLVARAGLAELETKLEQVGTSQ